MAVRRDIAKTHASRWGTFYRKASKKKTESSMQCAELYKVEIRGVRLLSIRWMKTMAWRSAQRLGAELDLLWVADHDPSEEEQEQVDALTRIAGKCPVHRAIEGPVTFAERIELVSPASA